MGRVIVIGGGAAGFFGAIACAEAGGPEVRILEKGPEVLGKVRISGGGRCNVTHACFEPSELAKGYPRGKKSLLGPFHRWQAKETVAWFESRGEKLKTEADGRIFPVSDDSRTVIECLTREARARGVEWRTKCGVTAVHVQPGGGFRLETGRGEALLAERLLVATEGIRSAAARKPAEDLGHGLMPPVPSLFTFHVADRRIEGLPGVSVGNATVRAGELEAGGPVLVTHWGLSGPAILKLSALGARDLAGQNYRFELRLDWTGGVGEAALMEAIAQQRRKHGARKVITRSPLESFPRRLWERLCEAAGVAEDTTWATLNRGQSRSVAAQLLDGRFAVRGKSLNKEEFVTCGGVHLRDVNLKTMESKLVPGLYFAGEVLDIDGITGGFNFQSAWTTGRIAGEAIAASMRQATE